MARRRNRVSVSDIEGVFTGVIEEYIGSVDDAVKEAVAITAQETVAELKETSPKRTGRYAKGWRQQTVEKRIGTYGVIYNVNHRLPHLLEKGHANRNGGRTLGHPHIAPAEEHAIQRLEERIRNGV